jgi:hypothetical protein
MKKAIEALYQEARGILAGVETSTRMAHVKLATVLGKLKDSEQSLRDIGTTLHFSVSKVSVLVRVANNAKDRELFIAKGYAGFTKQGSTSKKNKEDKVYICPHCGKEFTI